MTYPTVSCSSCGFSRDVMRYQRYSDPVGSAKRSLKKSAWCRNTCDIQYLAGVDVYGLKRKLEKDDDVL